jgi:hypothetical protein
MSTKISGADRYTSAEPNFSYLVEDSDNPEITSVSGRWSQILDGFYASAFHQDLEQKTQFTQVRSE